MGWFYDDDETRGHEGYVVAFTPCEPGSSLMRECGAGGVGDDIAAAIRANPPAVVALAAGCDCGWRSPRWRPYFGGEAPRYMPFCAIVDARDEARAHLLWRAHVGRGHKGERVRAPDDAGKSVSLTDLYNMGWDEEANAIVERQRKKSAPRFRVVAPPDDAGPPPPRAA